MEETYDDFIHNILRVRGRFACGDEYHERHHIKPKCLGGNDEEENLIDLFAREHFIAHKLLAKENPDNSSLVYAWSCMAFPNSSAQDRYELSPEEYEEVRVALSNARKGKSRSEEVKRKIGEKAKERYKDPAYHERMRQIARDRCTDEFKRKISERMKGKVSGESNPMFGRNHTEETKKKQSELKQGVYVGEKNPFYGKTHTEEAKEKIRIANKGNWAGEKNPFYGSHRTRGAGTRARKIVRLLDEKIYECIMDAAEDNHMDRHTVARHCKARKKFMYYDEWLTIQND